MSIVLKSYQLKKEKAVRKMGTRGRKSIPEEKKIKKPRTIGEREISAAIDTLEMDYNAFDGENARCSHYNQTEFAEEFYMISLLKGMYVEMTLQSIFSCYDCTHQSGISDDRAMFDYLRKVLKKNFESKRK